MSDVVGDGLVSRRLGTSRRSPAEQAAPSRRLVHGNWCGFGIPRGNDRHGIPMPVGDGSMFGASRALPRGVACWRGSRYEIGGCLRRRGPRAGRLTPLRSCASEPKPLARAQNEIACVERICAAGPAVAYGSAVNEDGGERGRR